MIATGRVLKVLTATLAAIALAACSGGEDDGDGGASTATGKATLDSAFGTNGVAAIPLNASTHDRFMAVAVGQAGEARHQTGLWRQVAIGQLARLPPAARARSFRRLPTN